MQAPRARTLTPGQPQRASRHPRPQAAGRLSPRAGLPRARAAHLGHRFRRARWPGPDRAGLAARARGRRRGDRPSRVGCHRALALAAARGRRPARGGQRDRRRRGLRGGCPGGPRRPRPAGAAGHGARPVLDAPSAHRRGRQHPVRRHREHRRLLRRLPAATGAGGVHPAGHPGLRAPDRLGVGADHGALRAADPDLHGADRQGHGGAQPVAMARARPSGRALLRRDRGAGHAQAVRREPRRTARGGRNLGRLPAQHHAGPARRLPVVAGLGVPRHPQHRHGRGLYRLPPVLPGA